MQILREYEKAPEVTRERLYIETLEEILSNSSKVLVDTEGGNNMLYLPLDQLSQRRSGATNDQSTSTAVPLSQNLDTFGSSENRSQRSRR